MFWQTAERQLKFFSWTYTAYVKLNVKKYSQEVLNVSPDNNCQIFHIMFCLTASLTCVLYD